MLPGDLDHLTKILDKNSGFTRPEGQITGFTLEEPKEGAVVTEKNTVAPVPAVSLPATIVDKQLNLPAPSLSKKAKTAKRERDIGPKGNELWSQEELKLMMQSRGGSKAVQPTVGASASTPEEVVGKQAEREEPVYSVLQQQRVTAEDVYLGVDFTRDAGSTDGVVVKVHMPKLEKASDLTLHVEPFQFYLGSPDYYLNAALPRRCVAGKADASWDEKKKVLEVQLLADVTDEVKMI